MIPSITYAKQQLSLAHNWRTEGNNNQEQAILTNIIKSWHAEQDREKAYALGKEIFHYKFTHDGIDKAIGILKAYKDQECVYKFAVPREVVKHYRAENRPDIADIIEKALNLIL